MFKLRSALLAAASAVAACAAPPPPPPLNDGYAHYREKGTYECGREPVSFDGSHTDTTLSGHCTRVRIYGSHNDMLVYVMPGAVIEITGDRNDVTWRQIRRGPPPTLINHGDHNEFYRNSRASWLADKTYYEN